MERGYSQFLVRDRFTFLWQMKAKYVFHVKGQTNEKHSLGCLPVMDKEKKKDPQTTQNQS